jgi:hypothetical protein
MGRNLIHINDHQADVSKTLGIITRSTDRLAGIEIETGWTTESKRSAFFRQFDRLGLSDMCISKHDGTIGIRGQTYPAEIVSAPMPLAELRRFAYSVGTVIEQFADKGLVTDGCGIHIHLSEGMFTNDVLWRFATSICQHSGHIQRWTANNRGTYTISSVDAVNISETVHDFWSDIALRKETDHCRRLPHNDAQAVRSSRDHTRAFIHGRHTPTFETRIFRTSKSARVIASYVDVIEALYEFCSAPPADQITAVDPVYNADWFAEMKRVLAPQLHPVPTQNSLYYDNSNGDQYTGNEVMIVDGGGPVGAIRVPNHDWLTRMNRRIPVTVQEALVVNGTTLNPAAAGWKFGTLPLRVFINYVTAQKERYPHLAQRLTYDKFQTYLGEGKPKSYTHIHEPHLEFQRGCLCRMEYGKGEVYQVQEVIGDSTLPHLRYIPYLENGSVDVRRAQTQPINKFIHACPGAMEPGGEI